MSSGVTLPLTLCEAQHASLFLGILGRHVVFPWHLWVQLSPEILIIYLFSLLVIIPFSPLYVNPFMEYRPFLIFQKDDSYMAIGCRWLYRKFKVLLAEAAGWLFTRQHRSAEDSLLLFLSSIRYPHQHSSSSVELSLPSIKTLTVANTHHIHI